MVSKADQAAAETALRANIRRFLKERNLTQRAAGADAGMENPDQTMSDFLTGKAKQLDYAYLGPLAKAFRCELSDLFSPVQESNDLTSLDTPERQTHSSKTPSGDAHGTDARLLRSQVDHLEAENAQLRIALDGIADELKALAAVVKPRKTARGKPRAR